GLFAAIPAVLAYNSFSASADSLMIRYETFADEFSGILHREAHAGQR
ncbi:MAG: protein TolQ, partial [Pseudomonadales bacterium]|nr:protein TolQ [Pseudomonadales bacterium]